MVIWRNVYKWVESLMVGYASDFMAEVMWRMSCECVNDCKCSGGGREYIGARHRMVRWTTLVQEKSLTRTGSVCSRCSPLWSVCRVMSFERTKGRKVH